MAEPIPAREQVMAALVAALETLTGVTVERNLTDEAMDEAQLPAIALIDGDHDRDGLSPYEDRYVMTFELVYFVRGSLGRSDGPGLNRLAARVTQLLAANPTLGGLVRHMEEQSLIVEGSERDEGRAPIGGATHRWQAEFYTPHGDPFTLLTP